TQTATNRWRQPRHRRRGRVGPHPRSPERETSGCEFPRCRRTYAAGGRCSVTTNCLSKTPRVGAAPCSDGRPRDDREGALLLVPNSVGLRWIVPPTVRWSPSSETAALQTEGTHATCGPNAPPRRVAPCWPPRSRYEPRGVPCESARLQMPDQGGQGRRQALLHLQPQPQASPGSGRDEPQRRPRERAIPKAPSFSSSQARRWPSAAAPTTPGATAGSGSGSPSRRTAAPRSLLAARQRWLTSQ